MVLKLVQNKSYFKKKIMVIIGNRNHRICNQLFIEPVGIPEKRFQTQLELTSTEETLKRYTINTSEYPHVSYNEQIRSIKNKGN